MLGPVLIWSALVPAAVALVVMFIGLRPFGRQVPQQRGAWAGALALGLGYAAGNWGLTGGPGGGGPEQRLLFIALGAAALGLVESLARPPAAVRWLTRVGASAAAGWLLLAPLWEPQQWSHGQLALRLGLVTATSVLVWSILDWLASEERGPSMALALAAAGTIGASVIVLSGLASTGQLSGAMVAPLGVLLLVTWRFPAAARLRSAVPPATLLLVSHPVVGLFYAEMPLASFALLAAAPLAVAVVRIPWVQRRSRLVTLVLRLAAVSLPAGGAVAISATHYLGLQVNTSPARDTAAGDTASGESADPDDDYDY